MAKNVNTSDREFQKRLRTLRRESGLNRRELADRAKCSERTIMDLETGQRKRSQEKTLMNIAAALDLSLNELLGRDVSDSAQQFVGGRSAGGAEDDSSRKPDADPPGPARRRRPGWLRVGVGAALIAVVAIVLSLMMAPEPPTPPPIRPLTTDSPRAHAACVAGLEHLVQLDYYGARRSFQNAVEHDSTFAFAWAMRAHPDIRPDNDTSREYVETAAAHAGDVTEWERLHIYGVQEMMEGDLDGAIHRYEQLVEKYPDDAEAWRLLGRHRRNAGNLPEAVAAYEAAVKADPRDGMSLNRLAYLYLSLGDTLNALEAANQYVDLAPDEHNPYDTRGDVLSRMGEWRGAIASYEAALERDPDFFPSIQSLGCVHALVGNYDEADRYLHLLHRAKDVGASGRARLYLGSLSVLRGDLDGAVRMLQDGMAADRIDHTAGVNQNHLAKLVELVMIQHALGNADRAEQWCRRVLDAFREHDVMVTWPGPIVRCVAAVNPGRAAALVDSLDAVYEEGVEVQSAHRKWMSRGWLAFSGGGYAEAASCFRRARARHDDFEARFALGLALVETGDAASAATMLEDALGYYGDDQMMFAVWSVEAHYHLGRTYEALGRTDDAAAQYREFLDHWGANESLPLVVAARERHGAVAGAPADTD